MKRLLIPILSILLLSSCNNVNASINSSESNSNTNSNSNSSSESEVVKTELTINDFIDVTKEISSNTATKSGVTTVVLNSGYITTLDTYQTTRYKDLVEIEGTLTDESDVYIDSYVRQKLIKNNEYYVASDYTNTKDEVEKLNKNQFENQEAFLDISIGNILKSTLERSLTLKNSVKDLEDGSKEYFSFEATYKFTGNSTSNYRVEFKLAEQVAKVDGDNDMANVIENHFTILVSDNFISKSIYELKNAIFINGTQQQFQTIKDVASYTELEEFPSFDGERLI